MKSNGGHQTDQAMWIVGAEVCTPLGVDAATSQAEVLAGTLRFADTEVNDLNGEPARACRLSLIAENVSRTKRMTALAAMAFRNHLEATAGLHLGNRMPLPVMLACNQDHSPSIQSFELYAFLLLVFRQIEDAV